MSANDLMAIGILGALRELGLDVPRDVSVVGFDDIFLSNHPLVRLTTIHHPKRETGAIAARLLLRRISEDQNAPSRSVIVHPSLVVRGTSGPPRRKTPRATKR